MTDSKTDEELAGLFMKAELADMFLEMVLQARVDAGQKVEHYKRRFVDTGDPKFNRSRVIWHSTELVLNDLLERMNEVNLDH